MEINRSAFVLLALSARSYKVTKVSSLRVSTTSAPYWRSKLANSSATARFISFSLMLSRMARDPNRRARRLPRSSCPQLSVGHSLQVAWAACVGHSRHLLNAQCPLTKQHSM